MVVEANANPSLNRCQAPVSDGLPRHCRRSAKAWAGRRGFAAAMIQICLLGAFEIRGTDGRTIEIEGRKGRALVAYLACPPIRQHPREQICGLLWGDRGEDQARGSLRQLLASLRKCFHSSEPALVSSRESVGLNPSVVTTDAEVFERNLKTGTPEAIAAALRLYRGAFLQDLDRADAGYEAWVEIERRRVHESARRAAQRLVEHGQAAGDGTLIREAANRLIELEPSDERGHRALMRLLADEGDLPAAVRQHRICREVLERELGVKPAAETEELLSAIRQRRAQDNGPRKERQPAGHSGEPELVLGPTLAVLPFGTPGDRPQERHFADGLTQDIVTELSRFRSLVVRTGGDSVTDFVLSGSIRRLEERVRIAALLVDGRTGAHLWAEHYDQSGEGLFKVLDELVARVAATVIGRLEAACAVIAQRKPPASLAAYECVLRGDALPVGDPAAEAEARALYERAVGLDRGYARARAMLAYQLSLSWLSDLDAPDEALDRALALARSAVALDPCCSVSHGVLGWLHLLKKSFDLAERHKRRALELVPNSVYESACMGVLHTFLGDIDTALAFYARARALDPFYEPAWFWRMQGMAHFLAGRYDEAIACLERTPTMPLWVLAYLAATHALAERPALAADFARRVLAREPGFKVARFLAKEPLRREDHRALLCAGLRRAGLPGSEGGSGR